MWEKKLIMTLFQWRSAALSFLLIIAAHAGRAQVHPKGTMALDVYYGAPNFGKKLVNSLDTYLEKYTSALSIRDTRGVGPAGFRFEYFVHQRVGIGVEMIFNGTRSTVSYDSLSAENTVIQSFQGNLQLNRLRIQARVNYHLMVNDPRWDAYVGFGVGSNTRSYALTAETLGFNLDRIQFRSALIPISARICGGVRYYFTSFLGVHGEFGIGGPIFSGGLSLKL